MIITNDNEFAHVGETIMDVSELEELSHDLIEEFIDAQIEKPYEFRSNFVENFTEEYEKLVALNNDDSDVLASLRDDAREFYEELVRKINSKFDLDIDLDVIEELDFHGVQNVAEALYEFFIVNYIKNISKYLSNMIINNRKDISDELSSKTPSTDVSTLGQIEKLGDNEFAIIMANINDTVAIARSMEITTLDFIELFNQDYFDVAVIKHCIENHVINGDFVESFTRYLSDETQDYVYDNVVSTIQQRILKFYEDTKEN